MSRPDFGTIGSTVSACEGWCSISNLIWRPQARRGSGD